MSLASDISRWNRQRKWEIFKRHFSIESSTTILDVGYNEVEYSSHDNYLEKQYPYQKNITALGLNDPNEFKKRYPEVNAVSYDGTVFPFSDKSFDICWSNAVIEHVGDRIRQLFFLKEIRRVANRAFITTPNKWFPIELHTRIVLLHYFPKRIFDIILRFFNKQWAAGDYMHLLGIRDIKKLLKEAGIEEYTIIRNRLFFFTLDFIVVF